jgi:ubiquinone/menaquinone biosynthesis C-methylase UbiE
MYNKPILSQPNNLLKRFELQREDATFRLLDGGDRFIDIGCGEGNLVFRATEKYRIAYGVDIAPSRISRAKQYIPEPYKDRVCFQIADINDGIHFGEAYFDTVSCVSILEHTFNPIELLKEIHRVLKPNGYFISVMQNIAYLPHRINAIWGNPPHTSAIIDFMDGGILHYFTLTSITSLLKQARFSIVKVNNCGKFWFLRNHWKSLLASSFVIKAKRLE